MNPAADIIEVAWHGDEVIETTRQAAATGLTTAIEALLTHANQTVPHDQGPLSMSGTVAVDPDRLEAAVGYDTPYAIRLHEHPEYNFQGGRRGLWLQLTLQEQQSRVAVWLADELRQALT